MLKGYQPDLDTILEAWNLKAIHWERIKDVFKVTTDHGVKNLKVSPLKPRRLLFVHQAVNHLANRGFSKMTPLIPTINGKTYISDGHYAYTLYDWIEGRQCNFFNQPELIGATQVLAKFHQKSLGFNPPLYSNTRELLGKCLTQFEQRFQELQENQAIALKRPDDPFARVYLENYEGFIQLAALAINKLKASLYQKLVEQAEKDRPFCHGDPAARNFILTPHLQILIIDFDSCRLDLPIMDLIKFTRRVMKKHHWSYATARLVVDAYREINAISAAELEVMKAVFYFPQKFWRISSRYFHCRSQHSPDRLLQKFQKYLKNKTAIYQFPFQFDHYQITSELTEHD